MMLTSPPLTGSYCCPLGTSTNLTTPYHQHQRSRDAERKRNPNRSNTNTYMPPFAETPSAPTIDKTCLRHLNRPPTPQPQTPLPLPIALKILSAWVKMSLMKSLPFKPTMMPPHPHPQSNTSPYPLLCPSKRLTHLPSTSELTNQLRVAHICHSHLDQLKPSLEWVGMKNLEP